MSRAKKSDDFDIDFDFMDFDFGGIGDSGDIFGLKAKSKKSKDNEKFDIDLAIDELIVSETYHADAFRIAHKYAKQLRDKGYLGRYCDVFGEALRRVYKYTEQRLEYMDAHRFEYPKKGG